MEGGREGRFPARDAENNARLLDWLVARSYTTFACLWLMYSSHHKSPSQSRSSWRPAGLVVQLARCPIRRPSAGGLEIRRWEMGEVDHGVRVRPYHTSQLSTTHLAALPQDNG